MLYKLFTDCGIFMRRLSRHFHTRLTLRFVHFYLKNGTWCVSERTSYPSTSIQNVFIYFVFKYEPALNYTAVFRFSLWICTCTFYLIIMQQCIIIFRVHNYVFITMSTYISTTNVCQRRVKSTAVMSRQLLFCRKSQLSLRRTNVFTFGFGGGGGVRVKPLVDNLVCNVVFFRQGGVELRAVVRDR